MANDDYPIILKRLVPASDLSLTGLEDAMIVMLGIEPLVASDPRSMWLVAPIRERDEVDRVTEHFKLRAPFFLPDELTTDWWALTDGTRTVWCGLDGLVETGPENERGRKWFGNDGIDCRTGVGMTENIA